MSVTVVKDKGFTVVTVASDSKSMLPPLCQILKALCCSLRCPSGYKALMQSNTISTLGTIQTMVGLFNIGLGPGRTSFHPDDFAHLGAAYWLGGVFLVAGILSLIADRFPCPCMVGVAVFVNIAGAVVSVFGVVLYVIDIGDVFNFRFCAGNAYGSDDICQYLEYYLQRLMITMNATMIIMSVLQLGVCIIVTVLGIKALFNPGKEKQGGVDDEVDQPVLKEVLMTSPGA